MLDSWSRDSRCTYLYDAGRSSSFNGVRQAGFSRRRLPSGAVAPRITTGRHYTGTFLSIKRLDGAATCAPSAEFLRRRSVRTDNFHTSVRSVARTCVMHSRPTACACARRIQQLLHEQCASSHPLPAPVHSIPFHRHQGVSTFEYSPSSYRTAHTSLCVIETDTEQLSWTATTTIFPC